MLRRGKKKGLFLWILLPFLLGHLTTLCTAGPLSCLRLLNPSSSGQLFPGGIPSPCHAQKEAQRGFPQPSPGEGKGLCCDPASKKALLSSLLFQLEDPLVLGVLAALESFAVLLPGPKGTHQVALFLLLPHSPLYLLHSILLL